MVQKTLMIAAFSKESGIGIYSKRLCSELKCDRLDWSYATKWGALFKPFSRWGELKDAVKKYDVIHVQYHLGEYMFFFLPLLFLLSRKRCGVVLTLHEDEKNLFAPIRWYNVLWYRFAKVLIVHTKAHRDCLPCGWSVVVIPMGCEVKDSEDVDESLLLLPGFFNKWKGHDVALKALALVRANVRLVFVGDVIDYDYYLSLKQLAYDLGVDDRVDFVSTFITQDKYDEFISDARIVLLPYKNITMSAVAGEAVGWGKAVIASDLPAFKEYFESCFPSGDEVALANLIEVELAYPSRAEFSKLVRGDRSWERVAERTRAVYGIS